jgi:glycosyltransferase involved in cell wall biosynthesis
MQFRQACASLPLSMEGGDDRPLIVAGITNPQTCVVLKERLLALREAGFRVVLISSPGGLVGRIAAEAGIEVVAIPIRREIAPLHDLRSLWRLLSALHRLRPQITEFSTPKAGLLGSLAAKLCGVPMRVYLLRGLRLETLHGFKRHVLLAAERIASACCHHVVCNSESLRAKALALRVAAERKLRLIGPGSSHGVDVERFYPGQDEVRAHLGIPHHVPVIGFVGRLTRDKGVPELIEAFEEVLGSVPAARLLLLGCFDESEDAITEELRARIEMDPRIVRTGFVDDTAKYYRAMDMMVLPTWREGFPNVVLEAAASGIPVITTLSTGSRDAVVPEVTGLLIPAGYPEAITEAVLRLVRNPDVRHRMGRAARAWVIERFVNGYVLGLTASFYKGLLERPARIPWRRWLRTRLETDFRGGLFGLRNLQSVGSGFSGVQGPAGYDAEPERRAHGEQ